MKIVPLAFDSMGTRSMSTFIETSDCKILIDPGVALGPSRYRLPPHPLEWQRMDEHWTTIKKYAKLANILIVTHYHYDHHDPNEPEVYKNKEVYIKHPTENINRSQKERAAFFLNQIEGVPKKLEYADENEVSVKNTRIRFSKAVPHGANAKLGYVTEVAVEDGKSKFIHTSDVEGPSLDEQVEFILEEKPETIICDGPMTYMLGYRYSTTSLEKSIENIIAVIKQSNVKNFVFDHHFLRDLNWEDRIVKVFAQAKKKNTKILTAAEFSGLKNDLLEARRNKLYKEHPVSEAEIITRELEE